MTDRKVSHEFANGVKCYDPNPIVWANAEDCLHDDTDYRDPFAVGERTVVRSFDQGEVYYTSDTDRGGWLVACTAHGRIAVGYATTGEAERGALHHCDLRGHREVSAHNDPAIDAAVADVRAEGVETVDVTPPSWSYIVRVGMMVLRNPDASVEAIKTVEGEFLRLAKWADDTFAGKR